ncbi:MAG: BON domain-containing protein [Proteobacteria bacterium]|nr:BON domain-containing protein [Pseudomonadota bacterium]
MQRIVSALCIALCLSVPALWVGCASTSTRESTGEYIDDSAITAKVKTQLGADKMLSLFQINVETYKGVVQLSGFVNGQEAAEHAVGIARQVNGVTEVKNSLIVKPQ